MQPVCRSAPARPLTLPAHLGTTCQARATATSRGGRGAITGRVSVTPAPRPRARLCCVGAGGSGTTEPVVQPAPQGVTGEQAEAVAEVLESLEEAAIAGEDEGRRPTDYDRRAHIFEESSRVFKELKQRRDGDGGVHGTAAGTGDATARVK